MNPFMKPVNSLREFVPFTHYNIPLVERMRQLFEYDGPGHSKDFVIRLGPSNWILVHKAIVEAGSPILHQIIKYHEQAAYSLHFPYISLYSVDGNYAELGMVNFRRMIEFMYTDEVKGVEKASKGELQSLLRLSGLFLMTRLKMYCIQHLSKKADSTSSSSSSSCSSSCSSSSGSSAQGSADWVVVDNSKLDSEEGPLVTENLPTSPRPSTSANYAASEQSKLTLSIAPKLMPSQPPLSDTHISKSTIQIGPCRPHAVSSPIKTIQTTSAKPQIKEELLTEVKTELKQQLMASLKAELLQELKESMVETIRDELKDELRDEMVSELKETLHQEILNKLEAEVREEIVENVKEGLIENLTDSIKSELMDDNEFFSSLKEEITSTLKDGMTPDLVVALKPIIENQIIDQLEDDGGLNEQILAHLKDVIQSDSEFIDGVKRVIDADVDEDEDFKSELKTKLGQVVFDALEKQLQDKMEEEITGDLEFKEKLTRDCKATLQQQVKQEVLGKIKDDLVEKLRNELSDEVADAIRHDLY